MPRGGARKGTPGKGYSNRTDMMTNRAPDATGTAASGGMTAPAPEAPPAPAQPMPAVEDTPNLFDDTQFPDEPITAGLPVGAGPGPDRDTRQADTQKLRKYLPLMALYLDRPDTPDSVRNLYRYIKGS